MDSALGAATGPNAVKPENGDTSTRGPSGTTNRRERMPVAPLSVDGKQTGQFQNASQVGRTRSTNAHTGEPKT